MVSAITWPFGSTRTVCVMSAGHPSFVSGRSNNDQGPIKTSEIARAPSTKLILGIFPGTAAM